MGQPADSMAAAVREDYLPDLTRPYHNLLSVTRNDGSPAQTFYWDSNAAAMEENGTLHYYLQDEMGSPLRVSGYDSTDSMADGNHGAIDTYLTYGYDEFGNDLARTTGKELEEAGIPNPYTMQGEGQPFGYTGYRYDTLGATYFAQAREYDPQTGRFHAQDVIAGNGAVPVTLNRYGYCLGNPVGLVDLDGKTEELVVDNILKAGIELGEDAQRKSIEQIMKNMCHSYWYTPQGLWESQASLALDSELLRMSDKGKETLKYLELNLEGEWAKDLIESDPVTGEVMAVKPYYVKADQQCGITFGFGHFISYEEVMNDPEEMKLFTAYINTNIDEKIFDWTQNKNPNDNGSKPFAVPGATPVPIEVLNELFEADVESMTKNMLNNFEKRDLKLTIQKVDALMIYRFQHGYLGEMADWVENGLPKELWNVSGNRNLFVKELYFGDIFTYEDCEQVN